MDAATSDADEIAASGAAETGRVVSNPFDSRVATDVDGVDDGAVHDDSPVLVLYQYVLPLASSCTSVHPEE